MTDRDRLIELIEQAEGLKNNDFPSVEEIADHILADGWIRMPCKVGDAVYEIEYNLDSGWWEGVPIKTEVKAICILTENDYYPLDTVGKDVFLTLDEALKEREGK